ncbi:calcium-binding protein [Rhizobium sp. LjRoot254]|uniref:calcium-binding protein n=1 Tax=Rhizobium sp. LjRoot254 TaxID=3342297 RepID=UPI003ECD6EF2
MAKPVARLFDEYYTADLDTDDLVIGSGTKTKMVTVDTSSLDKLVIEGRNFKYEDGCLNSGIINKLTLMDSDGTVLETITGMKIDADQLAGATLEEFLSSLITRMGLGGLKIVGTDVEDSLYGGIGKDVLIGKGGDDLFNGAGSKDLLFGGGGSDTFQFSAGTGRDTIKDFDADGGGALQDYIHSAFANVDTITQVGKDTVVDFGNGDAFVLKNVDADLVTMADFIV